MRAILTLSVILLALATYAQPYAIGSRNITYFDAARNRNVPCEIRYPGVSAGSNVDVASGEFPVLVMGHGFAMTVGAYANLWNHFVPKGYIMVLPTTEGGLLPAPNHGAFGQDLAFVATALQAANSDAASPFFGKVAPATALMGHSMGGGASFLGSANNSSIQTLVNFAAAETNPSAVAAAAQVVVPTLMFAGSNDCVTPIPAHQGPMYDALTTDCRAFVNITGGGHCYFANSNFNCDFGELTCSPSPSISRSAQHSVVNDFAGLWLDHFLKGVPGAYDSFSDSLSASVRITGDLTCGITTSIAEADAAPAVRLGPVPADQLLVVYGAESGTPVRVLDALGREHMQLQLLPADGVLNVGTLPPGIYRLLLGAGDAAVVRPFVVAR